MDLILHIGTEKTGTTSIQSFLNANRAALAQERVFLSTSLGRGNNRRLPAIANDDTFVDDLMRTYGLDDPRARRKAKDAWLEAFDRELQAAQGMRAAIITSEQLQSRLTRREEIERLRDLLAARFSSVEVLIYLREPLRTATSLYSTAVQTGSRLLAPPMPDNPYCRRLVHHAQTLQNWAGVFGKTRMNVRLFDDDAFVGGSLLSDFQVAARLPDLQYTLPPRRNEALSHLGLLILARVNRTVPRFLPEGGLNPRHVEIVEAFAKHFADGARFEPTSELVNAYADAFEASNEWVRGAFFPDRQCLFKPPKAAASTRPGFSGDELDQLAAMIIDM